MSRLCKDLDEQGKVTFCPRYTNVSKKPCDILPKGIIMSMKRLTQGQPQTFCPIKGGTGAGISLDYKNLIRVDWKNSTRWQRVLDSTRKAVGRK